jgi:hypothetical protein
MTGQEKQIELQKIDQELKKDLPPLTRQILDFAKTMYQTAKAPRGRRLTTHEERMKRINACEKCEFRNGKRCGVCGCSVWGISVINKKRCKKEKF